MDNQQEIFPVVDEQGRVVGSATRGECHGGSKLLHPVVLLHVFNSQGDVYLQRRPEWKDIQPGKWDTGHGRRRPHRLRRDPRAGPSARSARRTRHHRLHPRVRG